MMSIFIADCMGESTLFMDSLADATDGLCDSHTSEECQDYLMKNRGILFDPCVVLCTVDNWQGIERVLREHPRHII